MIATIITIRIMKTIIVMIVMIVMLMMSNRRDGCKHEAIILYNNIPSMQDPS